MKKLTLIPAALMLCAGAYAQGTIQFVNSAATAVTTAAGPVGPGFKVELFYQPDTGGSAPAPVTSAGVLGNWTAGGITTVFNTPVSLQGVFSGPNQVLTGIAGGAEGWFEIVAWNNSATSLTTALAAGGASFVGNSLVWAEATGNPNGSPSLPTPAITGAGEFSGITAQAYPTPEPTTIALGALGAASLLAFRRKK
jgi:hypothetical protein